MKIISRRFVLVVLAIASTFALAACSSATPSNGQGADGKTVITYMSDTPQNLKEAQSISNLSKEYTKLHPNVTFKFEYIPQASINQKIQLLASQNQLPTIFSAGSATSIAKGLAKAGLLLNVSSTFKQLGIYDSLTPAGVNLVESVYGTPMIGIPKEANIDGFWYNKKMFADAGIDVPATWDDLVSDAAKLQQSGVQPFVTPGSPSVGWPVTRMIGEYIQRDLGADAMNKIVDGSAKLTDSDYVAGAKAIGSLGQAGYFGKGVASTDYPTGVSEFLTGKAAIWWMGSWTVADFNQPGANSIGNDNIGFFPFPSVKGGKGNDLTFMEPGETVVFSKKAYNPAVAGWMKYVFSRFGNEDLKVSGVLSGFKITTSTDNLPPLTKLVVDHVAAAKQPATWFDANFPAQATTVGNSNAGLFLSGQLSADSYMDKIQQAVTAGK
jgi:raffinose/stachyose/melibiose transport system substrate-binding protein